MSVVSYPTPAFSNPPIEPQYFQPWRFQITGITLGVTTVVTYIVPSITKNNYVVGQLIRLLIPPGFGCRQLNQQTAYVLSLPSSNSVKIALNSSQGVDAFVSSQAINQPQIVAVGDINSGLIAVNGPDFSSTNIPGAFINISPV